MATEEFPAPEVVTGPELADLAALIAEQHPAESVLPAPPAIGGDPAHVAETRSMYGAASIATQQQLGTLASTRMHVVWGPARRSLRAYALMSSDADPGIVHVHAEEPELASALACHLQEKAAGSVEAYSCRMWVLPAGTPFPEPAVPKGYSLRRLQEGDAALVNDRWPYGSDNTLARTRQTITALPSMCACAPDGEPVAWVIQQQYGGLGVLHTEEGHRRRGLARSVVAALLRESGSEQRHPPHCYIRRHNEASEKLFASLRFEPAASPPSSSSFQNEALLQHEHGCDWVWFTAGKDGTVKVH